MMNMKHVIPMVMMFTAPVMGVAQNKSGLVLSNLDKTAKPADDFYQFATGGWQKTILCPQPIVVMAVSTNCRKITTSV
jgi:hypothetical protein